jgi:Zn-dependent peptidase ImmA (M78 family)
MVRDQTGRFGFRPFYENVDMEAECEGAVSEFLIATRGKVEYPLTTDDLTVLIERYADLDLYAEFPPESEIHGVTIFRPNRRPEVRIDRELTEDDRRMNRLRTTLAHEFGHVRLHNILFQTDGRGVPLFGDSPAFEQTCKLAGLDGVAGKDWMEAQAGYVCTALLAPSRRVAQLLEALGFPPGPLTPDTPLAASAIGALMEAFAISRDAARVRLSVLGRLGSRQQGSLLSM